MTGESESLFTIIQKMLKKKKEKEKKKETFVIFSIIKEHAFKKGNIHMVIQVQTFIRRLLLR